MVAYLLQYARLMPTTGVLIFYSVSSATPAQVRSAPILTALPLPSPKPLAQCLLYAKRIPSPTCRPSPNGGKIVDATALQSESAPSPNGGNAGSVPSVIKLRRHYANGAEKVRPAVGESPSPNGWYPPNEAKLNGGSRLRNRRIVSHHPTV